MHQYLFAFSAHWKCQQKKKDFYISYQPNLSTRRKLSNLQNNFERTWFIWAWEGGKSLFEALAAMNLYTLQVVKCEVDKNWVKTKLNPDSLNFQIFKKLSLFIDTSGRDCESWLPDVHKHFNYNFSTCERSKLGN